MPDRAVVAIFSGRLFSSRSKLQNVRKEGFANLATDSDYSYLADHVNANRTSMIAVTCCYDRIFSTAPQPAI
jgi:hypothetical protein